MSASLPCRIAFLATFAVAATLCAQEEPPTIPVADPAGSGGAASIFDVLGGEKEAEPPVDESPTAEEIEQRQSDVEAQIEQLRLDLAGAEPTRRDELRRELDHLERVARLIEQQLDARERASELERALEVASEAVEGQLEDRFGHRPPYSVRELDAVLGELEAARKRHQLLTEAEEAAVGAVESAEQQREDLESRRRLAKEALDASEDPSRAVALRRLLEDRQRASEVAEEQLRLRRLQLAATRHDLALQERLGERLQAAAGELRQSLEVNAGELEEIRAELAERAQQLERDQAQARADVEAARARWSDAQQRLGGTTQPGASLLALAEARRLELEAAERRETAYAERRERLSDEIEIWEKRFALLAGELGRRELPALESGVRNELKDVERESRLVQARLEEYEKALRDLRDRQATAGFDAATGRWLGEQATRLEELVALQRAEIAELDRERDIRQRLLDEIEERSHGFDERLETFGARLAGLWTYEVTAIDDRPITVSKIVLALLLMIVGYFVSRALSARLGRLIFPRLGFESGVASAYQTLLFYILMVVFFVYALHVVSIPLTVFTVLGGVVAIGVGFGSQNLVNNFMSGLILLAERPIKVGDLVDVDGTQGTVERIGLRSAWIRSGDNTHVIVPNSSFLENNVLNWTMSDDVLRTHVDVGVAYGSPVEDVAKILREATDAIDTILKSPEPEVLFMDFGDNALAFRSYFWVRVKRPLDLLRAQSALRFLVDKLFHQAGIVIAFPQRDVHLDSLSPLEVRMIGDKSRPSAPPPAKKEESEGDSPGREG